MWLIEEARRQDMVSVRQLIDVDRGLFQLVGRGVQLAEFFRSHTFCGYCGHEMYSSRSEWASMCPNCRQRYYPQIAPCIIVAIRRGDEILLAQHKRHRNGIHTVLAGLLRWAKRLSKLPHVKLWKRVAFKLKPALRCFSAVAVPALIDGGFYGGLCRRRTSARSKRVIECGLVSL